MDEVLAQSGLFQGLSEEAVEPVVSRLEMLTLPRGRVVFNEGEPGDSLYIVQAGKIKLSRRSPDGRENVLAVMGPSDQFGELSVFDPGPRTATVIPRRNRPSGNIVARGSISGSVWSRARVTGRERSATTCNRSRAPSS